MPPHDIFKPAMDWYEANKDVLEEHHPSSYICIVASTLQYFVGRDLKEASARLPSWTPVCSFLGVVTPPYK